MGWRKTCSDISQLISVRVLSFSYSGCFGIDLDGQRDGIKSLHLEKLGIMEKSIRTFETFEHAELAERAEDELLSYQDRFRNFMQRDDTTPCDEKSFGLFC